MITLPDNMELADWADQLVLNLDGAIGCLTDLVHWQDWAAQLLNIPSLLGNLPNPYQFTDWRDWANRLCGAMR